MLHLSIMGLLYKLDVALHHPYILSAEILSGHSIAH